MKRALFSFYCSAILLLCSCEHQETIEHYPTGEIKRRALLDSEGGFIENVTHYFKNGKIERVVPFKSHHINGTVKYYSATGKLILIENWVNGKRNGKTVAYYPNGQIKYKGSLRDTIRIDTAQWYYPNGQLNYWARYDKHGRKVDFSFYKANGDIDPRHMYPIFLSDKDTLQEGKDYIFEIVMGNRRTNAITIKFADSAHIDSTGGSYSKWKYIIRHPSPGNHVIRAKLYHSWQRGDTLWTNYYNIKHKFFIGFDS